MPATQPTPAPATTPAPIPPVASPPPAPRKKPYALILRPFSGFTPGQILDASDWRHTESLASDRFLTLADKDQVDAAVPCLRCKTRWLDEDARNSHDCPADVDPEDD